VIVYCGEPGNKRHIARICADEFLGAMSSCCPPRKYYRNLHHLAIDNGAFSCWINGKPFDGEKLLRILEQYETVPVDFVVCPDIVAGGLSSLQFSLEWEERLRGWPLYLAVQNDMPELDVERAMEDFDGLFVGGTMDFKYKTSEIWIALAHEHGLKCHIGRIGTVHRLQWAERIGADSVDSTNFTRNDSMHTIDVYRNQADGFPVLAGLARRMPG
jgi:hypothetical protein